MKFLQVPLMLPWSYFPLKTHYKWFYRLCVRVPTTQQKSLQIDLNVHICTKNPKNSVSMTLFSFTGKFNSRVSFQKLDFGHSHWNVQLFLDPVIFLFKTSYFLFAHCMLPVLLLLVLLLCQSVLLCVVCLFVYSLLFVASLVLFFADVALHCPSCCMYTTLLLLCYMMLLC